MILRLDREITVQKKAAAGDEGYIGPDPSYGTSRDVWIPLSAIPGSPPVGYRFPAEIQDLQSSRSEDVQNGLAITARRARVRIRYRSDVDSSMRVVVHGDTDSTWQIVTPIIEFGGRKMYLEFVVEKTST